MVSKLSCKKYILNFPLLSRILILITESVVSVVKYFNSFYFSKFSNFSKIWSIKANTFSFLILKLSKLTSFDGDFSEF